MLKRTSSKLSLTLDSSESPERPPKKGAIDEAALKKHQADEEADLWATNRILPLWALRSLEHGRLHNALFNTAKARQELEDTREELDWELTRAQTIELDKLASQKLEWFMHQNTINSK